MKKLAQKKLLWLTAMNEIAFSFIGIFWLFYIKESFGLSIAQTVGWFAIVMIIFGILVYPINQFGLQKIGTKKLISIGIFLEAITLTMLSVEWESTVYLYIYSGILLLHMMCFWPSYNYLVSVATKGLNRGKFLGQVKIILILIGVVTPVFTGWLFDRGWQNVSLWIALIFYLGAMIVSLRIMPEIGTKPLVWSTSKTRFKEIFFHKERFWGFLPNITDSIMWVLWPFYFQWVVGTFTVMGLITGFVALIEMFMAKVFGKLTDKFPAKSVLKYTSWARVIDLNLRPLYLIFNPIWFVTVVQSVGALLGPPYQIPYESRIIETGENLVPIDEVFDYFVIREIYIGLGRGIILSVSAIAIYFLGVWSIGIMIGLAGLSALGAKKL